MADLNAALSLLAYHPAPVPAAAAVGRDQRQSDEELQRHFGRLEVKAAKGCQAAAEAFRLDFQRCSSIFGRFEAKMAKI